MRFRSQSVRLKGEQEQPPSRLERNEPVGDTGNPIADAGVGGLFVSAIEGQVGFHTDANGARTQLETIATSISSGPQLSVQTWIIAPMSTAGIAVTTAVTTLVQ